MSLLHRVEPPEAGVNDALAAKGHWLADISASMGRRIHTILADPEAQTSQATIPSECLATPAT